MTPHDQEILDRFETSISTAVREYLAQEAMGVTPNLGAILIGVVRDYAPSGYEGLFEYALQAAIPIHLALIATCREGHQSPSSVN